MLRKWGELNRIPDSAYHKLQTVLLGNKLILINQATS